MLVLSKISLLDNKIVEAEYEIDQFIFLPSSQELFFVIDAN